MLEVREIELLQVLEQIAAHCVLDPPGGIDHVVATESADQVLHGRETDHQEGDPHDALEGRAGIELIDDRADQARWDDGDEARGPHGEHRGEELELVPAEVGEECRAGGRHSTISLGRAFHLICHIRAAGTDWTQCRDDRPPAHAMTHATAAPKNTGATP